MQILIFKCFYVKLNVLFQIPQMYIILIIKIKGKLLLKLLLKIKLFP